jgi:hypothetical protein
MTGRDLVALLGSHRLAWLCLLAVPPIAAVVAGLIHGRGGGAASPWRHVYAVLVYATCIPGILAAVLTGYVTFFSGESLLDLDLLVFLAPIVTMTATLLVIRRNVRFADVPGFDRLTGLFVLLAAAFVVALVLARLRVFLFFGGGIASFLVLAAFVFALLKWGAHLLTRRSSEPRQDAPRLDLP